MIARRCYAHAAPDRSANRCIPGNVNVVAQSAARIGIRSDHWLVVEVILAAFEGKESYSRIGFAAIARFGDSHFRSVDAVPVAEEHHDIAIENIALRIER